MFYGNKLTVIEVGISTAPARLSNHILGIRKIPVDISNIDMGKQNPFNVPPEIYRVRTLWDVPSFVGSLIARANRGYPDLYERNEIDTPRVDVEYANLYRDHLRDIGVKRLAPSWWKKANYKQGTEQDVKRIDYCFVDYDASCDLPSLRSVAAMVFGEWVMGQMDLAKNHGYELRIVHEGEIPHPAPKDRKSPSAKNTVQY